MDKSSNENKMKRLTTKLFHKTYELSYDLDLLLIKSPKEEFSLKKLQVVQTLDEKQEFKLSNYPQIQLQKNTRFLLPWEPRQILLYFHWGLKRPEAMI